MDKDDIVFCPSFQTALLSFSSINLQEFTGIEMIDVNSF